MHSSSVHTNSLHVQLVNDNSSFVHWLGKVRNIVWIVLDSCIQALILNWLMTQLLQLYFKDEHIPTYLLFWLKVVDFLWTLFLTSKCISILDIILKVWSIILFHIFNRFSWILRIFSNWL
jgi:hypothetical protein